MFSLMRVLVLASSLQSSSRLQEPSHLRHLDLIHRDIGNYFTHHYKWTTSPLCEPGIPQGHVKCNIQNIPDELSTTRRYQRGLCCVIVSL